MSDEFTNDGAVEDERAERIREAASRLIVHYGYDKTTMSEIATEAGVSKSTLYSYWKNKDDLFESLIWHDMMDYAEAWFRRIEADPRGGTMIGIYTNILYTLPDYPLLMAMFKQDTRVLGAYMRKQDDVIAEKVTINTELIRMMQQVGAVRDDIDPDIISYVMGMLSFALVSMDDIVPAEKIPPFEKIIEGIAIILDRALTPEGGGNSEAGKQVIRQILDVGKQQINQVRNSRKTSSDKDA